MQRAVTKGSDVEDHQRRAGDRRQHQNGVDDGGKPAHDTVERADSSLRSSAFLSFLFVLDILVFVLVDMLYRRFSALFGPKDERDDAERRERRKNA